jgi:hypothetical protein
MSELPNPAEAESVELLRLWSEGETLQCSLHPEAFDDPGAWGAILADVVRNLAEAVQQQTNTPAEQTVQRILATFQDELRSPASEER